jgi:hypothetical protein
MPLIDGSLKLEPIGRNPKARDGIEQQRLGKRNITLWKSLSLCIFSLNHCSYLLMIKNDENNHKRVRRDMEVGYWSRTKIEGEGN